jgi:HAD superfamily phosphatase (TIGR01668 family)
MTSVKYVHIGASSMISHLSPNLIVKGRTVECLDCVDISVINWNAIKDHGFKAVCFDKDNVLTRPKQMHIHEPFKESLLQATSLFRCAVLSNSVFRGRNLLVDGDQFIDCIPHTLPKPFCSKDLSAHFEGIPNSEVLFIGDRLFTDICMANRSSMFSIYIDGPISLDDENRMQKWMRKWERWWAGMLPTIRPFKGIQGQEIAKFVLR